MTKDKIKEKLAGLRNDDKMFSYKYTAEFGILKEDENMYCLIMKIPKHLFDDLYRLMRKKAKDQHQNIGNINIDINAYSLLETIFGENKENNISEIHPFIRDTICEFIRRMEFAKKYKKDRPKFLQRLIGKFKNEDNQHETSLVERKYYS